MFSNTSQGNDPAVFGRLWSFANCEFDDTRLELRVSGALVDLELKPLEVLLQLLVHAGEVISKERLLDSVWPGLMVVDGSLATAVSKLRKALGDADASIVLTKSKNPRTPSFQVCLARRTAEEPKARGDRLSILARIAW